MAKKKRFIADKVRNRKVDPHKKTNPFEVKINRQKHEILGRKISKHDRGLPGVSRSKANKRRKETLLQEYEQRFKSNQLVDRRLGEGDPTLSVEEKMLRRYAAEREKSGSNSKFNLNDDEELTHYGQSLSEIEKFDDPDISDDEEDSGRIEGDMVAAEHFGGFLTRKDPSDVSSGDKKSWKEKMEEVIAKSKKAKYERQSEKEKSAEMTEKLDEQWKDVAQLLGGMMGKGSNEERKPVADEYDMTVRELKYEMKGKATDRLKTEEELAKEEKERLEKLEADRVRRMKGILTGREQQQSQSEHRSADSLDDGFALNTDNAERVALRFHDGQMVREDEEENESGEDEEDSEAEKEDNSDEEEDRENDVDDDGGCDDDGGGCDDEAGSDGGRDTDDENDGQSDDSYADIASDSDGEKELEEKQEKTVCKTPVKSILKKKPETEEEKKKKDEMKKAAKKELPYTFDAPDSYDALIDLLEGRSDADQLTIIERVRKCHHASLSEGNKSKMETLLRLLIQYYGSLAVQEIPSLSLLDKLTRHIYDLTQTSPAVAADVIQRILQNQQADFTRMRERKKPVLITLDILLYLKLVSVLFPTSDFSHPVTTPAMLFMGQLLSQTPVNTERDVASGLFLCNLFYEYVSQSKRFVPETISFLHGVLFLAADKEENKIERLSGPFKPVGKSINLLQVKDKKSRSCSIETMKLSEVFGVAVERTSLSTPVFKLTVIQCCVNLLHEFSKLYVDLPAHREIFSPVLHMCSKLPTAYYPPQLKESLKNLVSHLKESKQPRQTLVFNKSKPKALQMFEPQIEESWDGRRKKGGSDKAYNEKQKLLHKVKKEMKGAMREIRKDTQFLARHQLQETLGKDAERKRKVKALYGNLANQEGDYNELKRKKKK